MSIKSGIFRPSSSYNYNNKFVIISFIAFCLFGRSVNAQYGGGSGEPNDPYLIYTAEQMNEIGLHENDWNKHFRLMSDIDLSSLGTAYNIIGDTGGSPFKGVFVGNGHKISNFNYESIEEQSYVGLFGYVNGQNAQITNLQLIDPVIHAQTEDNVGALVGRIYVGSVTACSVEGGFVYGNVSVGGLIGFNSNSGSITECFSTANVSGANEIGGLIGVNFGKITNCYSNGSVSGNEMVGGLLGHGYNSYTIINCYSTGQVSGTESIGGLVGENLNSLSTSRSFWDIETSGQTNSGGGTGLTTAEMQNASTFIGFWGCEGIWTINEGVDYPRLAWQNMPGELITKPCYAEGSGTETDPYLIYTAEQLNTIGLFLCDWDKHFKLMADIDLSEYAGTEFNIIGYRVGWNSADNEPFTGVFEGNGHTISNFNYSSTTVQSYIGIFGYIERATLENIHVIDPNINVERGTYVGSLVGWSQSATIAKCSVHGSSVSGMNEVGSLAGNNYGTVAKCTSTTDVSGSANIGGLVGNNRGTVTECTSSSSVSGSTHIGGIAGDSGSGSIGNCYSLSNVTGTTGVGGLVGSCGSQAKIVNCYSAGRVQGADNVGGLVGSNVESKILHCFWDIETSGQTQSAGGIGKATAEMQTASTFIGWGPYAVWTISEGLDYPRLLWENMPGELLTTPSFPTLQGSGTQDDPYLIYTAGQLNEIGLFQLEWDKHYRLMADIDLSIYSGTGYNIIGYSVSYRNNKPFTGVFEGNGHSISNFNISGNISYGGIFGGAEGAVIKDLVLIDPNVLAKPGGQRIGSLAGYLYNSKIDNCHVLRGHVSGIYPVGGLVGRSEDSEIINSSFEGYISGSSETGGLVGLNIGTVNNCGFDGEVLGTGQGAGGLVGGNYGTIINCTACAIVTGEMWVGGLSGSNIMGKINDSYSTGCVLGNQEVGGLIGGNKGSIENCFTTSDVSGATYVGGFAGQNGLHYGGCIVTRGQIHNCYAKGSVIGDANVGGLVGYNDRWGTIYNCYATGSVLGITDIGGLTGQNNQGDIINSFWDTETSGLLISADGTGKTTAEMQMADTFLCWGGCGAEGIWTIDEGKDYPRLWWENRPGEPIVFVGFSGTGSENNPYLIYTAEEMNSIGLFPCMWDRSFKLMADIDLSGYTETSFNIIGYADSNPGAYDSDSIPFTGVFDGNGHTISNFSSISADVNNVGLFGFISDPNAEIKNLGLISPYVSIQGGERIGSLVGYLLGGSVTNCYVKDCIVSGDIAVGGLIGRNSNPLTRGLNPNYFCRITNCYSTGSVTGITEVGGLIGSNYLGDIVNCYSTSTVTGISYLGGLAGTNNSSIADCYSRGSVAGDDNVGGLVGGNYRRIINCYSTGTVSGTTNAGGLIGYNDGLAFVYSSFWDIETSGLMESSAGEGKTTAEMQDPNIFMDAGWDFINAQDGPSDIWVQPEGSGYPILWWQLSVLPSLPMFFSGTGETNDPYLITTAEDLNRIGYNPRLIESHYRLISDIDLSGINFYPIGHKEYPYSGVFDGGGFKISNLTHTSTGTSCVGLFACLHGEEAMLIDFDIINANIDGGTGSIVGTLVGLLQKGTIDHCYVDGGNVSGNNSIGGLVGENDRGTITDCISTCSVVGNERAGGLVGDSEDGIITGCHSASPVSGNKYVGGLVGYSDLGTITQCSSSGSLNGEISIGGLVGYNNKCNIANCYSISPVSGNREVGGLVGYNVFASITNCYSLGNVSGKKNIGGLVGHYYYQGTMSHCYSAGNVQGTENVGGLLGLIRNDIEFLQCFWDIETSEQPNSVGGTGKTTAEMQMESTFTNAGWDFVGETANGTEDIWWILEGQDYPRLWWELDQSEELN